MKTAKQLEILQWVALDYVNFDMGTKTLFWPKMNSLHFHDLVKILSPFVKF